MGVRRGVRAVRSTAVLTLVSAALVATSALPAAATDVGDEAALRAAFQDPAETSIVVTADITLTDCGAGDLDRNSVTPLTVAGSGGGHAITQACPVHIFEQVGAGPMTFRNLTLQGGAASNEVGGAIFTAGPLTIVDSTVRNNSALLAGAIRAVGDHRTTIRSSSITGNTGTGPDLAEGGTGVGAIWSDHDVVVVDSTISNNIGQGGDGTAGGAGDGVGAIRAARVVEVTDSTIAGNHGTGGTGTDTDGIIDGGDGVGGIEAPANDGAVTVAGSTLADNVGVGGDATLTLDGISQGGDGIGAIRHRGSLALSTTALVRNRGQGGDTTNPDGIATGGWGVGGSSNLGSGDDVTITSTTFRDNAGTGGDGHANVGIGSGGTAGGALVAYFRDANVTSSRFEGNTAAGGRASDGGGLGSGGGGGSAIAGLYGETIRITASSFVGNAGTGGEDDLVDGSGHSGGQGIGAVLQPYSPTYGSLHIVDTTIADNTGHGAASTLSAGRGTGGVATGAVVTAVNSTVAGNTGTSAGGDAVGGLVGHVVELVHGTIVDNGGLTASNVRTVPSFDSDQAFRAFGTVVALPRSGPNCADLGIVTSHGHNLDTDGTCGFGSPSDASDSAAPLVLGPLADNGGPTRTRRPGAGSPLIDAIPEDACDDGDTLATFTIDVDQRGEPRPGGDACDVGALEVQPPPPDPDPVEGEVVRIAGGDRIETAAAVAADLFPSADTVFLATARNFPDALAGGPLAARAEAPILLTERDELAEATRQQLDRLQPATLVVLGGPVALSNGVVEAAAAAAGGAEIDRIAGGDRYATAAAIAARYGSATRAYLATGENFPDALTGAALAAARDDGPIVLTRPGELPTETASQLDRLSPTTLVVLGGTLVVSETTAEAAAAAAHGAAVDRLGGADRFGTAALVAAQFPAPTDVVYVATAANFPDALAGTPAAAKTQSPVLLTSRDDLPGPTTEQLERMAPLRIVILGGPVVVSTRVAADLEAYLR